MDDSESFCFLFLTELLFEGFIGGFMQSVLEGEAKVRLQASDMSVFSDVRFAGKSFGKSHRMKHDILVEHSQKGMFILDTKYKEIERFDGNEDIRSLVDKEVGSSDIYQVITYAHTRGISDVYLLYPLYRYEDIEPNAPVGINTSVNSDQPINVHLLRLPFVFEDDIESTKVKLTKVINDIFDLRY
jgi:5-methylcytosine-specific restriction endonuclease McrBC regulatory subunit McrC